MGTRMTKVDWDIINSALALYETEADADPEIVKHRLARIEKTRAKVWERMEA